MAKPPKKRKTTPRQRALIRELAKGASGPQAAIRAGYSPKNARQSAHQALQQVRHTVPQLLDKYGFSEEALIDRYLRRQLDATTTKYFAHEGKIISSRTMADNRSRDNALDTAFRLHGSFAPIKSETNNKHVAVIVMDVPRPQLGAPGPDAKVIDVAKTLKNGKNGANGNGSNGNGHKA